MAEPVRNYDGRYSLSEGPPYITDGRREVDPKILQRLARVAADFAVRGGARSPTLALRAIAALRYHVERLELFAVANARGLGWSWRDIAEQLGLSKQVLHRRYAKAFPRPRRRGQHH